jgi:murein DD-endopeptidase MepM/ murein hydrolase activator NlpD
MAMLGTIVLPAAVLLAKALKSSAIWAGVTATKMHSAASGAVLAQGGAAGLAATLKGGALGAMKSLVTKTGLLGLAVGAVAVGGFLVYKHWKKGEDALDEQIRKTRVLNNGTQDYADSIGKAVKEYAKIKLPTIPKAPLENPTAVETATKYFAEDQKGIDFQKSFEKNDNQQAAATQNYVESIELLGRTTSEAKAQLIALYQSIGMPQDRAIDKANEIAAAIGKAGDIDWATAVIEQSELFTAAINNMLEDGDKESKIAANEIGETFARQFGAGIAAGDKDQIKQMIEQISQMTIGGFEKMYDQILALGPESKEMLSGLDVDNAQELSDQLKIIEDTDLENLTEKQLELQSLMTSMGLDGTVKNLQEFSAQVYKSIEDYSGLQGEILNQTDVELNFTIAALTMTGAEADKYVKDIGAKLDNAIDPVQGLLGSRSYNPNANSTYTDEASARFKEVEEQTALTAINSFNQARGLKQGATHGESLWYYTMKIKAESQDTAKETGKIKDNLNGIEKNQDIRYDVKFGKVKMAAIRKQGMEGLTDDVSEELTSAFDDSMSAALESSQAGWDARSDALDRRQEDETDRFEARWERRKNAVEKLYARRIDNIDKVIEAEQKADEIRERIFEAERTRIERLNESANRSIDFNLALQTGDLDEAARLRNDMEAQAQEWALADAEASAGRKSGKKTDRLENQKDNLEKMQDQEMDALEKTEERQRKHLDRTQEAQKDSLDKQSEANMKYLNEQWKNEKELFDDKIELFKSMPAANQRELLKALKQSGLSLKGFGTNTLNPESERWGRFVQTSLVKHIRKAGNNIAKDTMWEKLGKRSAMQTLRGMGFGTMSGFKKFLKTGELPSDFGNLKPLTKPGDIPRNGQNTTSENRMGGDQGANARHEGGWIGPGAGSRKGVARTVKGVGPGERMVLARDNEFMVNEHSAKKHSGILNEINNGTFNPNSRRNTGDGVGGGGFGGALGGIVSAALNVGLAQGVGKAFQNAFAVKQQQIAASSMGMSGGTFTAGAGGMYSDRAFSSEQLKNAGIIASVGSSMGMSARDLMIGIMTAITESGLVNVDYGDRDSLGLFQQRPSQGWGTPAQVTDPEYASKKFFEGLKGLGGGRNSMTPWAAAQAVQRSAYADGSNYLQYWDNAQAIFKDGLERTKSGNGQMIYAPGQGGWSKASIPGKGWRNTHDYANGIGSPLFAVNDGRIIESRAITSGGSPGNGEYATPYRSYGETVLLQLADGTKVRYAHLDPNTRIGTGPVKGGTLIGKSGNTGNSSGPHTHFDINGDYNASGWFQKHGIGLKTGGYTKTDGMANLHKDEVVVSPKMTAKLYQGIEAMPKKKKSGVAKDWTSGMGYSDAWTWLSGIRDFVAKSTRGRGQDESVNGSTNVKTGTYNVLYKSSNSATQTDLKKLMPKTDILSLTEMANKKRGLIPWIKEQGWGYFGPGQRGNETGIAWNNRKYDFEKGGIKTLNPTKWGRNGWDELREATYALLRNKQTNQQLWQISAHTAGRTQGRMASAEGIMQQQYNSLNTLIKDLNKTGKPVFLAGDLNTKPEKHNYKYNFAGLTDTKSGLLDRILGPDGAKLLGQRKIGGLSSDHQALLASFNIPSLAKGAENIRWDNTLINAHKGESVLTKDLSDKFKRGVDNFASGGNSEYNVKVYVTEPSASADQIANKVMLKLKQEEARKPIKRRSQ